MYFMYMVPYYYENSKIKLVIYTFHKNPPEKWIFRGYLHFSKLSLYFIDMILKFILLSIYFHFKIH